MGSIGDLYNSQFPSSSDIHLWNSEIVQVDGVDYVKENALDDYNGDGKNEFILYKVTGYYGKNKNPLVHNGSQEGLVRFSNGDGFIDVEAQVSYTETTTSKGTRLVDRGVVDLETQESDIDFYGYDEFIFHVGDTLALGDETVTVLAASYQPFQGLKIFVLNENETISLVGRRRLKPIESSGIVIDTIRQ
ncbi:hypothetical protein K1X76_08185 [bacterium]|nr:hypothetical protein [bacterium]